MEDRVASLFKIMISAFLVLPASETLYIIWGRIWEIIVTGGFVCETDLGFFHFFVFSLFVAFIFSLGTWCTFCIFCMLRKCQITVSMRTALISTVLCGIPSLYFVTMVDERFLMVLSIWMLLSFIAGILIHFYQIYRQP